MGICPSSSTHILRVQRRSGNVHDGKAGLPFLRDLWPQLTTVLPRGATVRFRMDGAFFRQDVLQWLAARGTGYAITVPFYRWRDLQQYIRATPTWTPLFSIASAIVTDPPYYDSVPYADISDFLYVWLREPLGPTLSEAPSFLMP